MLNVAHTHPTTEELLHGKLETMGIEAAEALEEVIAAPVSVEAPMEHAVNKLIFIGDAHAQLYSDPREHNPEAVGNKWVNSSLTFIEKGIKRGRVSKSMANLVLLRPEMGEQHVEDWQDARKEVFWQNPGYHGPRYGREYAQAVAYGKVTLRPHADFN